MFLSDSLIPSLQGIYPGAEEGDLFFLLLQLNPLFLDLFVGDALLNNRWCVSNHVDHRNQLDRRP